MKVFPTKIPFPLKNSPSILKISVKRTSLDHYKKHRKSKKRKKLTKMMKK